VLLSSSRHKLQADSIVDLWHAVLNLDMQYSLVSEFHL
jgi:hypothetical protein